VNDHVYSALDVSQALSQPFSKDSEKSVTGPVEAAGSSSKTERLTAREKEEPFSKSSYSTSCQ